MSALLIAVIVVACCALYLFAGWRIAMSQLPRAWAAAREAWSTPDIIRSSVKYRTCFTIFFWPIVMPYRLASAGMDGLIDSGDPVELARKVADRDRRIGQLERELGMGQQ